MGAHTGSAVGWDTNRKTAVSVCREKKNHHQRILFAKMLSDALKLSHV